MADRHTRLPPAKLEELARARERRRIADGLHDDVGQVLAMARARLAAIKGTLALAQAQARAGEPVARDASGGAPPGGRTGDAVAEVCGLLDRAIATMRTMTFELASSSPEPASLDAELEGLGCEIAERNGIRFRLRGGPLARELSGDSARVALKSVRELLINVLKHAQAGHVSLEFARRGDRVVVTVRDDGDGFDPGSRPAEASRNGGLGLARARDQVRRAGGRFVVRSAPGHGTSVSFSLPADSRRDPPGHTGGPGAGSGEANPGIGA